MTSTLLPPPLTNGDQRVVYPGITWAQFKLIQAGFAQSPGIKLAYSEQTIEILMPGREHEMFSRLIGFLIGLFCLERAIEFEPTGSMTQEKAGEVSVQADESYCFGISKPTPDLVVEVIFTSGGPSKLERYRILGVPEVWFWQDGVLQLFHLHQGQYRAVTQSEIPELASLDMALFSRCVLIAETSRLEAAQVFRAGLG
ncbi:MAG: Uma2 family endonuclease [Spirulina sp. SIO3F2]|nr:Uma2 family endonuclease [Spirulina sp. SIO3F2]